MQPRLNIVCFLFSFLFLVGSITEPCHSDENQPASLSKNRYIKDIVLAGVTSQQDRTYLGLEKPVATLCDIRSDYVWVQIFSIYCPRCQQQVSNYNKLYELIRSDPYCRTNVKMIGIGAGNSDFEVKYFRKHYRVRFPLFSDHDFCIHKTLGEPRTPFVFLAQKETDQLKILTIFDPTKSAQDQFRQLKKTVSLTTLVPFKKDSGSEEGIFLINRNCRLWNFPNGKPVVCLIKGIKVKKIGTDGNWCKIETLDNASHIQGWLPF